MRRPARDSLPLSLSLSLPLLPQLDRCLDALVKIRECFEKCYARVSAFFLFNIESSRAQFSIIDIWDLKF